MADTNDQKDEEIIDLTNIVKVGAAKNAAAGVADHLNESLPPLQTLFQEELSSADASNNNDVRSDEDLNSDDIDSNDVLDHMVEEFEQSRQAVSEDLVESPPSDGLNLTQFDTIADSLNIEDEVDAFNKVDPFVDLDENINDVFGGDPSDKDLNFLDSFEEKQEELDFTEHVEKEKNPESVIDSSLHTKEIPHSNEFAESKMRTEAQIIDDELDAIAADILNELPQSNELNTDNTDADNTDSTANDIVDNKSDDILESLFEEDDLVDSEDKNIPTDIADTEATDLADATNTTDISDTIHTNAMDVADATNEKPTDADPADIDHTANDSANANEVETSTPQDSKQTADISNLPSSDQNDSQRELEIPSTPNSDIDPTENIPLDTDDTLEELVLPEVDKGDTENITDDLSAKNNAKNSHPIPKKKKEEITEENINDEILDLSTTEMNSTDIETLGLENKNIDMDKDKDINVDELNELEIQAESSTEEKDETLAQVHDESNIDSSAHDLATPEIDSAHLDLIETNSNDTNLEELDEPEIQTDIPVEENDKEPILENSDVEPIIENDEINTTIPIEVDDAININQPDFEENLDFDDNANVSNNTSISDVDKEILPTVTIDTNEKMIVDDVNLENNTHLMRLENTLDDFSNETGARLDVLQTSVDKLTVQVSSLETQIHTSSAEKTTLNSDVITKLEKRMSVLEGRMMHLEEIFAEQKMLNDRLSTMIDEDASCHAVAESKVELELELLHKELVVALDRITSLEDNLERDVAKAAAKVIKEEIIPLISEM